MNLKAVTFAAVLASIPALFPACSSPVSPEDNLTRYVDVKIGSGGHGHVFVGASVPFGAVQLGPTSIPQSWDWCSGYHDSDSTVIGFSHTHLSGTGIGDLFDITLMPVTSDVTYARGVETDQASGLWSYADRTKEVARPGYYSVPLTRYGITAEMTSTCRVGLSRYTFPASDDAAVVIDLQNGGCWDSAYDTGIEVIDSKTIKGRRFSHGWAKDQKIFFYAVFDKPFESLDIIPAKETGEGEVVFGRACFKTAAGEQVMVKVAISPVSEEN
ncbi:MAG: metal-independent alpha-mannosidase, partial [Bacteroidales bacterium]|nr:metal-independent alpha-mannosidase [Bacteroidales bacterium]